MTQMRVTLIDSMGSDRAVFDAARVSFGKRDEETTDERRAKLIRYLAREGHWSPFAHTAVSLHVKAPIFVARQLAKHQVGAAWNEVSRRYVDDEPEFHVPEMWRARPEGSVKQGSGDALRGDKAIDANTAFAEAIMAAEGAYAAMMEMGVAPEQARAVLPQATMTEWVWTGSVLFFARVFNQRTDPHAQRETAEVARMIGDLIAPLFPVSWFALTQEAA